MAGWPGGEVAGRLEPPPPPPPLPPTDRNPPSIPALVPFLCHGFEGRWRQLKTYIKLSTWAVERGTPPPP